MKSSNNIAGWIDWRYRPTDDDPALGSAVMQDHMTYLIGYPTTLPSLPIPPLPASLPFPVFPSLSPSPSLSSPLPHSPRLHC